MKRRQALCDRPYTLKSMGKLVKKAKVNGEVDLPKREHQDGRFLRILATLGVTLFISVLSLNKSEVPLFLPPFLLYQKSSSSNLVGDFLPPANCIICLPFALVFLYPGTSSLVNQVTSVVAFDKIFLLISSNYLNLRKIEDLPRNVKSSISSKLIESAHLVEVFVSIDTRVDLTLLTTVSPCTRIRGMSSRVHPSRTSEELEQL